MSSGSGGTSTSVTNNAPPQQFLDAYQNIVNRAQGVAGTPYQQYPNQTVADLSPDQLAGIQGIQGAQGTYAPYIDTAADYINSGLNGPNNISGAAGQGVGGIQAATGQGVGGIQYAGQAFTPESIQQFVNPWTQQVVDATQAQFANQNQQQANGLRGNAISAGAFGGDREGVAQGVLAGQQQLAQAPVLAGLRSTGYQTGIQAAETQAAQRLQAAQAAGTLGLQGASAAGSLGLQGATANTAANLQGSQQMAALGQLAHNSALGDAGALLGAGGLEQQQAQALLNVPYQQWQAELAYPFQTTSWLSGLTTGLGGASGGMSSSTGTAPGASVGSQALGIGLAGLGALGQSKAFGDQGWLTGSNGWFGSGGGGGGGFDNAAYQAGAFAAVPEGTYGPFAANGGAIPSRARGGQVPAGFAFGGMTSADVPGMTPVTPSGLNVPDMSVSVIPPISPGGKPLVLNNFGQTSNSSGGGPSEGDQALSAIGTVAKVAGLVALLAKGGRVPDFSAGMHNNDNWNGGWHEPKRAVGGPVTGVGMVGGVPHLLRGTPIGGMSSPTGGGGIQAYLSNMRANAPAVHPMAWSPSMMPVPAAPVAAPVAEPVVPVISNGGFAGDSGGGEGGGHDGPSEGGSAGYARNGGGIRLADGGDPLGFSASTPLAMASMITDAAAKHGIHPALARAYLQQESGMGATSRNIGQITDATAAAPGYGMQPISASDIQDPQKNIDFSLGYFRARGDAAGVKDWNDPSQWSMALNAYNGGGDPNYVQHVSQYLPGDTQYAAADTGTATDATVDDPIVDDDTAGLAARNPDAGGMAAPIAATKSSADPWSALTYAGLGVLGGNSPQAGVNIGRGALAGLHEYQQEKTRQQTADALAEYRGSQATTNAARIAEQSRHNTVNETTRAKQLADQLDTSRKRLALDKEKAEQGRYTLSAPFEETDPDDPTKKRTVVIKNNTKDGSVEKVPVGGQLSKPSSDTGKLSPDATAAIAERLMAGDQGAMAGLGYGNVGAANRAAVQEEVTRQLKNKGWTGADLAAQTSAYMGERAGARTAGTREANVSMAINEAQSFMPLALDASDKVARTNFPTFNSILQAVEKGTGDENVVRLAVATNSLINAYSRAVTPSGIPTEGNQQRARELLDRAWSQGQYKAAVDQLWKEMAAAKQSPIQTRDEQRTRISGTPSTSSSTSSAALPAVPAQAAPSLPPDAASKLQEGRHNHLRERPEMDAEGR
jgi:hypothetical protein